MSQVKIVGSLRPRYLTESRPLTQSPVPRGNTTEFGLQKVNGSSPHSFRKDISGLSFMKFQTLG